MSYSPTYAAPGRYTAPGAPRKRGRRRQAGIHATLVLIVAVGLFPYLFMAVTSFKDRQQFGAEYFLPSFPLHFSNYAIAWELIQPYLIASVVVALASIAGIVAISLVTGFVLARYRFAGRNAFFVLIASLMMVPSIASLIPLFVLMKDLGLINTLPVLILPHIASGAVIGTILMRTYIEGIPQELFDAARIDGAGPLRLFSSITLPLSGPVIGTVSLVTIIGVWNDFFWPLLTVTRDELKTVGVGLLFFQGQSGTDYGPMFAGYILASIPLLLFFIIMSRYFLAGIQGGLPGAH
jgi:ABC-type glycerol-3-phosphate transport system permease component